MEKTGTLFNNQKDKRYYHSVRPYFWPHDLVPKKGLAGRLIGDHGIALHPGFIYQDGRGVPGSVIGGPEENRNDRASAWYMVANVTNLALAWHFTQDKRYADYATNFVDSYLLSEVTGMHPSLMYAQDGHGYRLETFYFFLDAIVLLERSGTMSAAQVQ
jgi:hypothetical protein